VRSILLTALLLGSLASAADADEAEEAKNLAEPTDVRKEEGRAAAPAARFEKDRVRSVQLKPYLKAGRISLTASGGLSLNDAFYTKLGGSLGLAYHLRDTLAFGLRASLIRVREEDDLRTARANFQSGIVSSSPEWLAMGEVEWAPLYGKVAVYGSILHFDGYFLGGLGTVWARSPELAFEVGAGLRLVAKDWLAFSLSYQHTSYVSQPAGGQLGLIQNLSMVSLGTTVFFPFSSAGGGAQ
jgi:outer membrane beta-barrel protein